MKLNFSGRNHHNRIAFTLIELLVVIAIIAILAAILFPVFARARENARRSSCQSNLKQIGLGIFQYTQDYDEKFPSTGSNGTTGGQPWQDVIQPYVKSIQLFKCPSNTVDTTIAGSLLSVPGSYYSNGRNQSPQPISDAGQSLAQLNSSSQVILVCEIANRTGPSTGTSDPFYWSGDITIGKWTLQNHLGMTNFLFADGHVKSLKPTATVTPTCLWTSDNSACPNSTVTDMNTAQQNMQ